MSALLKGRCLCGAVTYSAQSANRAADVCHCSMCRRWTAGPFFGIGHDGEVTFTGEDKISIYKSSAWGERAFCSACGSTLYWRLSGTNFYSFSTGTLDDEQSLKLANEIFIEEKPAYYGFAGDARKLTGKEAMAVLEDAMKAK